MKKLDVKEFNLFDIAKIHTGKSNRIDSTKNGKYPLFDRSSEIKKSNKYLFDEKAILVPGEGQEFIPRYYEGKYDLHQRVYAIVPNDEIVIPRYLYYAVYSQRKILEQVAVGSTVKSLRLNSFSFLNFALPNKKYQAKITSILYTLDKKIEINNKINEKLETLAQTLYKHWFVDFEFPNEEGLPYKSSGGKMVESEVGNIPKGWEIVDLEKYLNFERGIEPGAKNYKNKDAKNCIPFIRVGDIKSYNPVFVNKKLIKNKIVKESDVLVSFDGAIGRVKNGFNGSYSTGLRKVYSKNKLFFSNEYIYWLFKSDNIQKTIHENANGTTIIHASSSIKHLKTAYNEKTVRLFTKITKAFYEKILSNYKENQKLANLRDLLLPKLMSGEIRVPIEEE